MKIKIKGSVRPEDIAKAIHDVLKQVGYDPERQEIKGATVYFNIYDQITGELNLYVDGDGAVFDSTEWTAPKPKTITLKAN